MSDLPDPGIDVIGDIHDPISIDSEAHCKAECGDTPVAVLEAEGCRSRERSHDAGWGDQPDLVFVSGDQVI